MVAARSVFSIAPGLAVVDQLAAGVLERVGPAPDALAAVTVLLPNHRTCLALREAFLRRSRGRPLLLPRIAPIALVDEDELMLAGDPAAGLVAAADLPPEIPRLRREILLTRLILRAPRLRTDDPDSPHARGPTIDQAARLARALARLFDQMQRARLDWSALAGLVTGDLATHWNTTLDFLTLVTTQWSSILAAEGCLDPQDRRNRLLEAQAAAWRAAPPAAPVIVAGTTGSVAAADDLVVAVAGLPAGMVVLPGLDPAATAGDWAAIRRDPSHPQHGMITLLDRLAVAPEAVAPWRAGSVNTLWASTAWTDGIAAGRGWASDAVRQARARLMSEVMRPADTSDAWSRLDPAAIDPMALAGVHRVDAAGPHEEATAIALMMREAADAVGTAPVWPDGLDAEGRLDPGRPGRTVALATPSRDLARRVAAVLRRWGLAVDDSAGTPLGDTAAGSYLRLIARAVADDLGPVPLLGLLKHPLAAGGMARSRFVERVRLLEAKLLRGPRPGPGIDGLRMAQSTWLAAAQENLQRQGDDTPDRRARLADQAGRIGALIDRIERALAPLLALADRRDAIASPDLLDAHIAAGEALATAWDAETGTLVGGVERLWAQEAGNQLARFVRELRESASGLPPLRLGDWPGLFDTLLADRAVRPAWGRHPRLAIWGTLEARLQQPDLLILGGLNEGSWPGEPAADPWMSRPMRRQIGLPSPERQIGQAAEDFAQGFCCPEVVLTRAEREDGTPTVPSRWLRRLQMVLDATRRADTAGWPADRDVDATVTPRRPLPWTRGLDRMAKPPPRARRPMPRPPVGARPKRLSVTQIETLRRDPYAVYARHVLGLKALDPINADPSAADRGQIIHKALELFVARFPTTLPPDPYAELLRTGREAFADQLDRPAVDAFWWPRYCRISRWVADRERERRPALARVLVERRGQQWLRTAAGPFELYGFADRIDHRADGQLEIIDYKTGALPAVADVVAGLAPQLALEALIAEAGGFEGVEPATVTGLRYWHVTGGTPPGVARPAGGREAAPAALVAAAREGIQALLDAYARSEQPYVSLPDPAAAPSYNDYLHLARVGEWSLADDGDDP